VEAESQSSGSLILSFWYVTNSLQYTCFFAVEVLVCTPVFFSLFAAEEPSANVCVARGTLCNDQSVYIATTA